MLKNCARYVFFLLSIGQSVALRGSKEAPKSLLETNRSNTKDVRTIFDRKKGDFVNFLKFQRTMAKVGLKELGVVGISWLAYLGVDYYFWKSIYLGEFPVEARIVWSETWNNLKGNLILEGSRPLQIKLFEATGVTYVGLPTNRLVALDKQTKKKVIPFYCVPEPNQTSVEIRVALEKSEDPLLQAALKKRSIEQVVSALLPFPFKPAIKFVPLKDSVKKRVQNFYLHELRISPGTEDKLKLIKKNAEKVEEFFKEDLYKALSPEEKDFVKHVVYGELARNYWSWFRLFDPEVELDKIYADLLVVYNNRIYKTGLEELKNILDGLTYMPSDTSGNILHLNYKKGRKTAYNDLLKEIDLLEEAWKHIGRKEFDLEKELNDDTRLKTITEKNTKATGPASANEQFIIKVIRETTTMQIPDGAGGYDYSESSNDWRLSGEHSRIRALVECFNKNQEDNMLPWLILAEKKADDKIHTPQVFYLYKFDVQRLQKDQTRSVEIYRFCYYDRSSGIKNEPAALYLWCSYRVLSKYQKYPKTLSFFSLMNNIIHQEAVDLFQVVDRN